MHVEKKGFLDFRAGNRSKSLLKMKFTAVMLLAAFLQVSATTYSQQVTLNLKNATLQNTILGRVTDTLGLPLEGATITVKETNKMAVTNKDGQFSIDADPGQSIVVSYIGYGVATYKLGGNKSINIQLVPQSQNLKSIALVYTGYQALPRERSTGSFSTVNNEDINKKSLSMNVVDRLEGLVPGLSVNYGASNEKFLIRGLTTIQASRSPLIVVDGVPISDYASVSTLINPQDVESMTVLRDATAASIWGAAAANGVIVIETKKGKSTNQPDYQTLEPVEFP